MSTKSKLINNNQKLNSNNLKLIKLKASIKMLFYFVEFCRKKIFKNYL